MSLLVVVTARAGSKRLPGKNVRPLAGRTLLEHTARALSASGIAATPGGADVILSTDDERAAAEGKRLGWSVPFLRPAELADDTASSVDVVLHALDFTRQTHGADPDAVMLLQPTSPLRGPETLTLALERFSAEPVPDCVVGVSALGLPARLVFAGELESGFLRSVDETSGDRCAYVPNGAMYLARTEAFRRSRSFYAGRVAAVVLDAVRSIDIDTEQDFRLAECALETDVPLTPPQILGSAG